MVVVVGGLVVDVVLVGAVDEAPVPPDAGPVGAVVGVTVGGSVVLDGGVDGAGSVGGVELDEEPGCSFATVTPITAVTPPVTRTAVLVSLRIRASTAASSPAANSARVHASWRFRAGLPLHPHAVICMVHGYTAA